MSTSGVLSGTATEAGSFPITVTATDSSTGTGAPFNGSQSYTLTVNSATVVVAPASLPAATAGAAYNQTITASGGTAPYTFAVTVGTLPTGLTLSTSGVLSGTPTIIGNFPFTVTATDSSTGTGAPFSGSKAYSLTSVQANQSITFNAIPAHTFGDGPFTVTATASSGLPVSFSALAGPITVSGNTVTITGFGTAVVRAAQAGDVTYTAAPVVDQAFTISPSNAAPVFSSQPTATPNPAVLNQSILFVAAASDKDGDTLTYKWDFGDGTTASGSAVTHTYIVANTYSATVTATNPTAGATSATVSVTVNSIGQGGGATPPGTVPSPLTISNADGIPDEMQSGAASVGVASVSAPQLLPDANLAIKLVFSKPGSDSISLQGTLIRPANFNAAGAPLVVDIGGVVTTFTLNASGKIKSGNNALTISLKGKNTQTAKFKMVLSKGSFASTLANVGLDNGNESNKAVTIPVGVIFNNQLWVASISQTYKAKKGSAGMTKSK